jgi:acid phosphatase family membrane protein YuiD
MNKYQYLIAPFLGWVVAQSIKFAVRLNKDGIQWGDTIQSGGMPSSHSACMVALTTVIGVHQGFSSALFALSAGITGIILYDAMGVRRSAGQLTEAVKELSKKTSTKLSTELTNSKGHDPIEVFAGFLVGIVIGVLTTVIFK